MHTWPEQLALPQNIKAALLKHLRTPFQTLAEAKAYWQQNNIKLITSHRSVESTDSQISHIGLATKSKMLKVGIVGGERVAKLNELLRLSEHDLIRGMAEI